MRKLIGLSAVALICFVWLVGEKAFEPEIIGRFMFGDKLKNRTEQP